MLGFLTYKAPLLVKQIARAIKELGEEDAQAPLTAGEAWLPSVYAPRASACGTLCPGLTIFVSLPLMACDNQSVLLPVQALCRPALSA